MHHAPGLFSSLKLKLKKTQKFKRYIEVNATLAYYFIIHTIIVFVHT